MKIWKDMNFFFYVIVGDKDKKKHVAKWNVVDLKRYELFSYLIVGDKDIQGKVEHNEMLWIEKKTKRKRSHLNLQDVLPLSLLAQSQLLRVGMLFVSLMQHFIFQHCCIDTQCANKKKRLVSNKKYVRTMYIDAIYYDEFILLECLHIYTHKHIYICI